MNVWFWLLGAACIVLPAVAMWGFTVDDALITIRYARHVAAGIGYRWNADGPVTDGVTPLPFAFMLVPFAWLFPSKGALDLLFCSRCLGIVCSALSGGLLAIRIGALRIGALRFCYVGLLACSLPLAAHTVTGMETPMATALVTWASLSAGRPQRGALLAGLATTLRPELFPWALVLSVGFGLTSGELQRLPRRVPWREVLLATGPFLVCAAIRLWAFGRPVPLSVYAKPSDVRMGFSYAVSALTMSAVPFAVLLQVRSVVRTPVARTLAVAGLAHAAAVALAGGDWMSYGRLIAPVVPSLILAAALAAPERNLGHRSWRFAPPGVAAAIGLLFFAVAAGKGRHVLTDRVALIAQARGVLDGRKRVASADVGWVSAATEATILDLAGVTDPEVAVLPGSHTSKRIDDSRLRGLRPDALLLYADRVDPKLEGDAAFSYPRAIDARLARSEFVRREFRLIMFLPLGSDGRGYVLLGPR